MAGKANELTFGLVLIVSLPLIITAYWPPTLYWDQLSGYNPNSVKTNEKAAEETASKFSFYGDADDDDESVEAKRGTWFLKNVGAKHLGK